MRGLHTLWRCSCSCNHNGLCTLFSVAACTVTKFSVTRMDKPSSMFITVLAVSWCRGCVNGYCCRNIDLQISMKPTGWWPLHKPWTLFYGSNTISAMAVVNSLVPIWATEHLPQISSWCSLVKVYQESLNVMLVPYKSFLHDISCKN